MEYSVKSTFGLIVVIGLLLVGGETLHKPAYLFNQPQATLIFQQHFPTLMLLLGDLDEGSQVFDDFSSLSNQYPDILFTYSRKGSDPYLKLLQFVGVQMLQMPTLLYFSSDADKYLFESSKFGELNPEHVRQFVKKAQNNELEIFYKSHESREDLDDEELEENKKYLTYYNSYSLRDALKESEKELVLVIYATWCIYSERLSPHFTQVAKRMQNNKNIMFGKIDGNWNQIRGFQPEGYPTIAMFRKDRTKSPVVFTASRDADTIINWIQMYTKYPWVEPLPAQKKIEKVNEAQNHHQVQTDEQKAQQVEYEQVIYHEQPAPEEEQQYDDYYEDEEYYYEDYNQQQL